MTGFAEKPHGDGGWINGGFFVLSPEVRDYLDRRRSLVWEREPLEGLARDGELSLYRHDGFWQPMDTRRELLQLQAHVGLRQAAVARMDVDAGVLGAAGACS